MSITKESNIAVLCGGISSEREISLRSGKNCFEALLKLGYKNTTIIDIKSVENLFSLKNKDTDVAFLITHGKFGEDGVFQSILELLKIPYTGSSVLGSAISMDKWITKLICKSNNILNPKAILITKNNLKSINLKTAWEDLSVKNNAVFLKPKDDGSSVNTFKIKSLNELQEKINLINLAESDYLIEEHIAGRELTVGIIETPSGLKVLPILELKPKNEFYDYHAKYTKGMTEFILPAKIIPDAQKKIEENTINIFTLTSCSSFGRVDYILDKDNNPYLLEINSLPGMTDTSDLPAQAACAGISFNELVEIILKSARLHK